MYTRINLLLHRPSAPTMSSTCYLPVGVVDLDLIPKKQTASFSMFTRHDIRQCQDTIFSNRVILPTEDLPQEHSSMMMSLVALWCSFCSSTRLKKKLLDVFN